MEKLGACALLLILAISLPNTIGFCQADDYSWPFVRHDSQNTGFAEGLAPSSNDTLWMVYMDTRSQGCPIFSNGKVFAFNGNGTLFAFNATDGKVIWQASDLSWGAALAVAYGMVFIGSYNDLVAFDENSGRQIYNVTISDHLELQAINAANGKLFISSHDDYTYCINASSGAILWKALTYLIGSYAPPAVSDGLVFQSSYCLNETDGSVVWQYDGFYGSTPSVADGKVFFLASPIVQTDLNSSIVCLNQQTGQIDWQYHNSAFKSKDIGSYGPSNSITAVAYQKVFALVNGTLYALDENTGQLIWVRDEPSKPLSAISPVVAEHRVFVADHDYILGLDVNNGEVVWSYTLSGARNRHIIADGILFAMNAGSLIAIGELPKSPSPSIPEGEEIMLAASIIVITSIAMIAKKKSKRSTTTCQEGTAVFSITRIGRRLTAFPGLPMQVSSIHCYSL